MQRKGMVDALHEAHRVLAPRGLLIDARPDTRVLARAEHRAASDLYVTAGIIRTARAVLADDRASDRAVGTVKRQRLFRSVRRGRFWHGVPFDDLAGLEQYLAEHLRFEHRVRWRADAAKRRAWRSDPWVIRRAVRYEVLRRLEPPSAA